MSWTEITVLVERAKTGDREAYVELVTRFQSSVYAMALSRVRDPLEAQELAQDVFVHAMRKLPQLRDARCFAGWLRRITARMAINRLTRRGPLFGADPELLGAVEAKWAARVRPPAVAEAKRAGRVRPVLGLPLPSEPPPRSGNRTWRRRRDVARLAFASHGA